MTNTRPKYCRWGAIQTSTEVVPGIRFVSTASHGGYILSKALNDIIPDYVRSEDRCYEEDCAWSIVVCCFPFITDRKDQLEHAHATMKQWYPSEYEAMFHTEVLLAESYIKRKEQYEKNNKDNWRTTSAFGAWHENVPENFVGVRAQRHDEEKWFLVPEVDYKSRGEFSFIVNPSIHQEVQDFRH